MDEHIPSPKWMQKVATAASAPNPSDAFRNGLRLRLEDRAAARRTHRRRIRRNTLSLSFAAVAILGGCVLIAGPANVAAAIREALGYVPGFGVVHTSGLRMLAEPVSVTREGITVTIKSVIADSEQTSVSYEITGLNLPPMDPGSTPDPNACAAQPSLRLPDGKEITPIGGGGMFTENSFDGGDQYPSLPEDADTATLVFPCLPGTMPGTAPENWVIPFRLVRSSSTPTVFPVQLVDTPTIENAAPTGSAQANPFLGQISIALAGFVEVDDGFILMGTVRTSSDRYQIDPFFPPGAIEIRDATGADIPAEMADVGSFRLPGNGSAPSSWAYKIRGKNFQGQLTLSLKWVAVSPVDPIVFNVDVGAHPQVGQTWTLNQPLDLLGVEAIVQTAEYVERTDIDPETMRGLSFCVQLPDEIEGLQLNYWDIHPHGEGSAQLTDGFRYGQDVVQVGFVTTAPISGSIGVTANVIFVDGPWTFTWNPPAAPCAPSPSPNP
jgi:hypothetical protein